MNGVHECGVDSLLPQISEFLKDGIHIRIVIRGGEEGREENNVFGVIWRCNETLDLSQRRVSQWNRKGIGNARDCVGIKIAAIFVMSEKGNVR